MAILWELKQRGQFYEFLHLSWGLVEFTADEGILMAYCLSSQDVRAKPLLEFSFGKKIMLFRNMDILSIDDYNILHEFKNKRNELFHTGGLYFPSLTDTEKEGIMDTGLKAVEIMQKLVGVLNERQRGRYLYLKKEKEQTIYDK